jgi:hypothetical protein
VEYIISKTEIARRKRAYIRFCIYLILGIILGAIIFHQEIYIFDFIIICEAFFLIGVMAFSFFHNLFKIKIFLSDHSLLRTRGRFAEEYLLAKITRIDIKRTKNSAIREIYIWFRDGKSIFITALTNFEEFKEELLGKIGKRVIVKEKHEFIEFDHPSFYTVLGLSMGIISMLIFGLFRHLNYKQIKIWSIIFFAYLIILGLYLLIAKPISRRSGEKTVYFDYILGLLLIISGVAIFFSSKLF